MTVENAGLVASIEKEKEGQREIQQQMDRVMHVQSILEQREEEMRSLCFESTAQQLRRQSGILQREIQGAKLANSGSLMLWKGGSPPSVYPSPVPPSRCCAHVVVRYPRGDDAASRGEQQTA